MLKDSLGSLSRLVDYLGICSVVADNHIAQSWAVSLTQESKLCDRQSHSHLCGSWSSCTLDKISLDSNNRTL